MVDVESAAIDESACPRAAYSPVKENTRKGIIVRYCDKLV